MKKKWGFLADVYREVHERLYNSSITYPSWSEENRSRDWRPPSRLNWFYVSDQLVLLWVSAEGVSQDGAADSTSDPSTVSCR